MQTTITNPAFQFSYFTQLQNEVRKSLHADDLDAARIALSDIECLWMHTDWPRMREATATFLREHVEYAELARFVA